MPRGNILLQRSVVFRWFAIMILIVVMAGCDSAERFGYAPYDIQIVDGWTKVEDIAYPGYVKKFSSNLPKSVFNIEVEQLVERGGPYYATLDGAINKYQDIIKKDLDANIVWIKDVSVNGIPAKAVMDIHNLTIRNTTREVWSQAIIFVIKGYSYSFRLGSFEEDFDKASKDFEAMVYSFQFQIPEKYKDAHIKNVEQINRGDYR